MASSIGEVRIRNEKAGKEAKGGWGDESTERACTIADPFPLILKELHSQNQVVKSKS